MAEAVSTDPLFIRRLTGIVLDNLHNEHFGVLDLSREAGLSRSVIHRKLRSIRNQNINQFIRGVRLKKALELLKTVDLSVSEIAFQVGFGSPAYFSKCFHEFFGCTPLEARTRDFPGLYPFVEEADKPSHEEIAPKPPARSLSRRKGIFIAAAVLLVLLLAGSLALFNDYLRNHISGNFRAKDQQASIMVLPFKNLSGDPDNQYFADGIMEDILNDLCRISELRVISRTTSDYYRDASFPAGEIARFVKAENVLEGSVRRFGDQVRVSVQLIDAVRDQHLWSASYDRELKDIFGIQSDIALNVAHRLKAVITEKERIQIEKISTQSPEAYDAYLRARFLLHKANSQQRFDFERSGVMNCLQYYEKAIAADSLFAMAYAGMANAWFNLSAWNFLPAYEGFPKAREMSLKAIALDPECAEAYAVLGAYRIWGERRFEEGRELLMNSLRLNPNFSTAHQWYAQLLMITGPIELSRFHIDRALELEPYFWVTRTLDGWISYFEQNHQKAIGACKNARDLNPGFITNAWLLFLNYVKLGDGDNAARELQSIAARFTADREYADGITKAYRDKGIQGLFYWLIEINKTKPLPVEGMNGHPFFLAWWNAILGDKEEAMYWLEKNMELQMRVYHYFNLIATNPDFDILRDDPRFLNIVDEIGLTAYHHRAVR